MLSGLIRWSGLAAMLGGIFWMSYGVFEMLEPWGGDVVYRDDEGYSVITNTLVFVVYSLPGSLALLTSLGLLGVLVRLLMSVGRIHRIALVLVYVTLALSVLSLAGVIVLFDPLFTSGRIFGSLVIGTATLLTGVSAFGSRAALGWTIILVALGLAGIFLLPLWPLVYALQWVPEAAGAVFVALFGFGWMPLGYVFWSERSEAVERPAQVRLKW